MSDNPGTSPKPASPAAPAPVNAPLSTEATSALSYLRTIDPNGEGVGADSFRPLFGKVGWDKILAPLNELVSAGLLKKTNVMNRKGGVGYQKYAVKG